MLHHLTYYQVVHQFRIERGDNELFLQLFSRRNRAVDGSDRLAGGAGVGHAHVGPGERGHLGEGDDDGGLVDEDQGVVAFLLVDETENVSFTSTGKYFTDS